MLVHTEPDYDYSRGNVEDHQLSPLLHDLKSLALRTTVGLVLNNYGLTGHAAEIGVMYGYCASEILKQWKGTRYYCVDLWEKQSPDVYKESQENVDHAFGYKNVQEMAVKDSRIRIIKDYSVNAAKQVPDDSLDFVFVDANHAFQAVLYDLNDWWPKAKAGAVFSGHDYSHYTKWPSFVEVKPAVIEWMGKHQVPFVVSDHSWWSVKP